MRLNRFHFFFVLPPLEEVEGKRSTTRRHLDRAQKRCDTRDAGKLANIAKGPSQTDRQTDNRRLATSGNIYED